MRKILAIAACLIIIICTCTCPASAFDLMRVMQSYEDGASAGRQRQLEEMQIEQMRIETQRMQRETQQIEQENRERQVQVNQDRADKELEAQFALKRSILGLCMDIKDKNFAKKALMEWDRIEQQYSGRKKTLAFSTLNDILIERVSNEQLQKHYIEVVRPRVSKVHPDFEQIILKKVNDRTIINPAWSQWAEKQAPAMRHAALQSSDPEDIIMAISAYKKDMAGTILSPDEVVFDK